MKAVNLGNDTYDIFNDTMQVYDKLPNQSYVIRFSENRGFFLEKYNDMEISETKIYGTHEDKVDKITKRFLNHDRNLGVILSGDKGIGKSLFAKMLAMAVKEKGIPLIVVNNYVPGIASYIENIKQEVMVLFDEYDKTFGGIDARDGNPDPQTELLSLFDGLSSGKKLFVITCNELYDLNEHLINRPGRFHYHIRFEYPGVDDIREYLGEKLSSEFYSEIDEVIAFSRKVDLNYDCLRAIATELNAGIPFAEAIRDLNIINIENQKYCITVEFNNGTTYKSSDVYMDLFDKNDSGRQQAHMYDNMGRNVINIVFNSKEIKYNPKKLSYILDPNDAVFTYFFNDYYDIEEGKLLEKSLKESGVGSILINKKEQKGIHYNL